MSNTQLHYLSIEELSSLIRQRKVSPVEVTQHMLARIDSLDPELHAYARVFHEDALAQARDAEAQLMRGDDVGPLHGIPLGIKDLLWVDGRVTAFGTTIHREFVPRQDATVVRRLRQAGAIVLGKLQMTEGAFALHHASIETPLNPWGAAHWSGASSSGSGVATAAGLCFASLGTDTGGSIRFPCAANGLTGIKPTWGRVSRFGAFEFAASLDHIGPMARSAADAALLLGVIAGHDPLDPTSLPEAHLVLPKTSTDCKDLCIGLDTHWNSQGTDVIITDGIARALKVMQTLGGELQELRFPDARAVIDEWEINAGVETAVAHADFYPRLASEYGPALTRLIDIGRNTSGMDYQRVLLNRAAFQGRLNVMLSQVDLFILPVQPYAAPTYEQLGALAQDHEANSRLIQYTAPIDSSGHPSITLPCGVTAEGLPIALQFIARHGGEAVLCRAGMAFQSATKWHHANPQGKYS